MSTEEQMAADNITVDPNNLYREDMFTDLKVATIRRLLPVKPDGSPDPDRDPMFLGQTQMLSQAGPLPVSCRLEGKTLEEAMEQFPAAMAEAVERLVQEVKEMQRQEASRIVVPGGGAPGGGAPGGRF